MPENFAAYGQEWAELNPGLEVIDWTDEMIFDTKWINQPVIDDMIHKSKQPGADMIAFYTHVADVIDYELCYKEGIYVNTDLKPIRPLPEFDDNIPWFADEDDNVAVNMAMYSPARGRLFQTIIERLPHRYFNLRGGMHITTGVGLIMDVLADYRGPVVRYPRNVYNPIHWGVIPYGTVPDIDNMDFPEETIAVHLWDHRKSGRGEKTLRDE